MRDIKFRIWETLNNKMIGWEDLQKAQVSILNRPESVVKDEFIVMQYTGLEDKNGKSIYEGDIVDGHPVVYHHSYFAVERISEKDRKSTGLTYEHDLIVTGNIYEKSLLTND